MKACPWAFGLHRRAYIRTITLAWAFPVWICLGISGSPHTGTDEHRRRAPHRRKHLRITAVVALVRPISAIYEHGCIFPRLCTKLPEMAQFFKAESCIFSHGLRPSSSGWLFGRHLRLFRLHLLDDPSYWCGSFLLFCFRLFCPDLRILSRLSSLPCLTCHLATSRHFRHLPIDFPVCTKILVVWLCYGRKSTPALKNGIMAQGCAGFSGKYPCIKKRDVT